MGKGTKVFLCLLGVFFGALLITGNVVGSLIAAVILGTICVFLPMEEDDYTGGSANANSGGHPSYASFYEPQYREVHVGKRKKEVKEPEWSEAAQMRRVHEGTKKKRHKNEKATYTSHLNDIHQW